MHKTEEIPLDDWIEFLDDFTREHQGQTVTMEVLDREIGAQIEADDVPLQGISADLHGDGKPDVAIVVGKELQPGLTHIIPGATHLRLESSPGGATETLAIEAADGSTTLLHVRLPKAA